MELVAALARSVQADMQVEPRTIERAVTTGTRDAEVCRQNLREEQAMAQFLDGNIEQVTRSYVTKAASGREGQSGMM